MDRKKVFDGKLIKVFRSRRVLPNGRKAYFEEIEHPGAAIVIPFIGEKIVFIRQYRGVVGRYLWELPAGKLSPGELPAACASRETLEETGYTVAGIRKIGVIYTSPGFCNEKIHIFAAECRSRKVAKRDRDELIEVRLLTIKEVLRLFGSGKISDAKTVATLAFAGIFGDGSLDVKARGRRRP